MQIIINYCTFNIFSKEECIYSIYTTIHFNISFSYFSITKIHNAWSCTIQYTNTYTRGVMNQARRQYG